MVLATRDLDRHDPMPECYVSVHSLMDANGQTDPTCLSVVYSPSPASDRQAVNGRWTLNMTESRNHEEMLRVFGFPIG